MNSGRWQTLAVICGVLLALTGCGRTEGPLLTVEVEHAGADTPLQLSLSAGADQATLNRLDPGLRQLVVLHLGEGPLRADERRLHLILQHGDVRHDWYGPELPEQQSHRLRLRVQPDGSVAARHCAQPCSLGD